MDCKEHLIIIKGKYKTGNIVDISVEDGKYSVKFEGSESVYTYNPENVLWLSSPRIVDISYSRVLIKGKLKWDVEEVRVFGAGDMHFYTIVFKAKKISLNLFCNTPLRRLRSAGHAFREMKRSLCFNISVNVPR